MVERSTSNNEVLTAILGCGICTLKIVVFARLDLLSCTDKNLGAVPLYARNLELLSTTTSN